MLLEDELLLPLLRCLRGLLQAGLPHRSRCRWTSTTALRGSFCPSWCHLGSAASMREHSAC
eukprot:scaffold303251_cov21-Tisochrysis_lutea.AAC.1